MAEQKLIISTTTPDGLDASKTISNINPEASNEKLAELGQKLNAFTDNTYGKTDRVIKYNCDTESGGGAKQTPTLSLEKSSCSVADISAMIGNGDVWGTTITTNSDGAFYVKPDSSLEYTNAAYVTVFHAPAMSATRFGIRAIQGALPVAQTITIGVAESNTYKAAEVTFTITA